MTREALTNDELGQALARLDGWRVIEGRLKKQFRFGSFGEALGWMVTVGTYAEKINHHPDWSNSYNKVTVELLTHDLGALSNLDVKLAEHMQQMFKDG